MKKFNILDIIIVLVLVVCIAGVCIRLFATDNVNTSVVSEFEYVIKVSGIRMFSVDALKQCADENSLVVDDETGKDCGYVYKVDFETKKEPLTLVDGTIKWVEVTDRYDAYVYVRTSGTMSEAGFRTASNEELFINKYSYFTTPWSGFNGVIADIGENLETVSYV